MIFWTQADQRALSELKLMHSYLSKGTMDANPQLREFVKARYYQAILAANRHERFFTGPMAQYDFGPVDERVIAQMNGVKGPEPLSSIYSAAMAKAREQR